LGWALANSGSDAADRQRLHLAQQQLRRIESIAEGDGCREQALLQVVGEVVPPCGRCDNCRAAPQRRQRDWSDLATRVLEAVDERDGCDLRTITRELREREPAADERWGWLARRLVQEELIAESDDGAQRLYLRSSGRSYLKRPWPLTWAA